MSRPVQGVKNGYSLSVEKGWHVCVTVFFYFCNTWRWPMGSRSYGTPKVCFESHMIRIKLFHQAPSILWGAKTVVDDVLHPIHITCPFCVSEWEFLSIILLFIVAHIKPLKKTDGNSNKSAFVVFRVVYLEVLCWYAKFDAQHDLSCSLWEFV